MDLLHLFYPPVLGGYLGCFSVLALVSNTVLNMGIQIVLQDPDFVPLHMDFQLYSTICEDYSSPWYAYGLDTCVEN